MMAVDAAASAEMTLQQQREGQESVGLLSQRDAVLRQLQEALQSGEISEIAAAAKLAKELEEGDETAVDATAGDDELKQHLAVANGHIAAWRQTVRTGDTIDMYDSTYHRWFEAKVLELTGEEIAVHYLGWNSYVFSWSLCVSARHGCERLMVCFVSPRCLQAGNSTSGSRWWMRCSCPATRTQSSKRSL